MTLLIGLLLAGTLLLLAEIFLPGMVAGMFGIICWIGAVVWAGMEFGWQIAGVVLVAEVFGGTAMFLLWMKWFPRSKFGGKFSLPETPQQRSSNKHDDLLGAEGFTLSALRPSGVATINNARVDVITEGRHLEQNQQVKVVKVEGSRIVVRPISNQT